MSSDPNAPTKKQETLKVIEIAIRKKCDADLLLRFDGLGTLQSQQDVLRGMLDIKSALNR